MRESNTQPMMEVIAPADLREGYEFEAEVGGQSFVVTVPPGGVEHGQKFMVPYGGEVVRPKTQVPVGAWKDGLCNCCEFGPCHNHLCMSCWCVPRKYRVCRCYLMSCQWFVVSHHTKLLLQTLAVAVGQVMTRLRLSWLGRPGSVNETTGSYQKILYFTIAYFSVWLLIRFLLSGNEPTDETGVSPIWVNLMILRDIMSYSFYFFSVYLLRNVRSVFTVALLILFSFSYRQLTQSRAFTTTDLMFAKSTPFHNMKAALMVMKIAAFLVGVHIW